MLLNLARYAKHVVVEFSDFLEGSIDIYIPGGIGGNILTAICGDIL